MATIKEQLIMDATQYQREMKKAKDSVDSLKKGKEMLAGASTKLIGALGLVTGGLEAMKMAMESSQTTSDAWENTVNSTKGAVDEFFYSLTTGDWSAFENGILSTLSDLRGLSAQLDEINDKKLSYSFIKADDIADINRFKEIAKDTTQSQEERINAAQNELGVVHHLQKANKELAAQELSYLNKTYKQRSGMNFTTEDIDYFSKQTNNSGELTSKASETYKRFISNVKQYNSELKKAQQYAKENGLDMNERHQKNANQLREQIALMQKQEGFWIRQGFLAEENDKKRMESINTIRQQKDEEAQLYELEKSGNRDYSTAHKGANKTSVPKVASFKSSKVSSKTSAEESPYQSLDWYGSLLKSWQDKLGKATDDATRQNIQFYISQLEEVIKYMKDNANINTTEMLGTSSKSLLTVNGLIPKGAKNPATELEGAGGALDKIKATFGSKGKSDTATYNDNLNTIANTINNIGEGIGGGAAAWLKWGANMASAIGTAIPLVTALTAVKKDEMHTDVVDAGATAAKSAAATPIIGWIAAIGAIAAVFASLAAAPKFANGGIFDGKYSMGDKMYARVNAGELILNRAQQRNIASQLTTIPNSLRNGQNIIVTGKVSGRDLLFAIDKNRRHYSRT